MKIVNYNLGIKQGVRLSKEAIFAEVDTEIKLTFDCSTKYYKHALTAILQGIEKRYDIDIVNGQVVLPPELIKPQTIKLLVRAELAGEKVIQWECEPLIIESLDEMVNKLKIVLPEYSELPIKAKRQSEEIAALQKKCDELKNALDNYKVTFEKLAARLKQFIT